MTTFNYTTGDPTQLTAGATADMTDISGPFADLGTFLNGGNLDYGNLAAATDSYYKTLYERSGYSGGATAGVIVVLANGQLVPITALGSAWGVFYLTSADYPSGTRTAKLRLAATTLINNTAPGINYTYGLYPVTAVGAAGANGPAITTLGSVVAGSTVAVTGASPNSLNHGETSVFSFPTAGFYVLGVATSGTETANSVPFHRIMLQFRAV